MSTSPVKRVRETHYEEQGFRFKLLPASPVNRERLQAVFDEREEISDAHLAAVRAAVLAGGEIPELEYGDREFYYAVLGAITSGPHDELSPDELDHKFVEMVLADFLPTPALTSLVQSGFLPIRNP